MVVVFWPRLEVDFPRHHQQTKHSSLFKVLSSTPSLPLVRFHRVGARTCAPCDKPRQRSKPTDDLLHWYTKHDNRPFTLKFSLHRTVLQYVVATSHRDNSRLRTFAYTLYLACCSHHSLLSLSRNDASRASQIGKLFLELNRTVKLCGG